MPIAGTSAANSASLDSTAVTCSMIWDGSSPSATPGAAEEESGLAGVLVVGSGAESGLAGALGSVMSASGESLVPDRAWPRAVSTGSDAEQ